MPKKASRIPFEPEKVYHLYNRGNNKENLFYSFSNYCYFLRLYSQTISKLIDTYAYCLLPNHFHFLIRLKDSTISKEFNTELRSFFVTYAMAINKQEGRNGSLFTKPVNRVEVSDELYFKHLVFYIHHNPVKHKITDDFRSYKFSSFTAISSKKQTEINKEGLLNYFNGEIVEFKEFHNYMYSEELIKELILED